MENDYFCIVKITSNITTMITNEQTATLNELRRDCAKQQKKGLHFILASVFIWAAVLIVHLTNLPIETKNILTFVWPVH